MTDAQFKQLVIDKIKSGSNVIYLYSPGDEERAEALIHQIATQDLKRLENDNYYGFYTWDWVNGASWNNAITDPKDALQQLPTADNENLFLFRDMAGLLNGSNVQNTVLRRSVMELCKNGNLNSQEKGNVLVVLSDNPIPHTELRDYVDVVDVPMPGTAHMEAILSEIKAAWLAGYPDQDNLPEVAEEISDKIVQSLLGLTSAEAVRILAYASRVAEGFNTETINVISEEKVKFIRKIEGLQFIPNSKIMSEDEIGGYGAFKTFIKKRARAYTKHAHKMGLERPRGVVLVGCPGTGKTMVAKAAARILGLDLIIMDMSSFLDSYVGNSEKKQRAALATISAMPNALIVADEVDKIFSGAQNSTTDSGVTSHLLSTFLAWLNDRDMADPTSNRAFVAVTANRIHNLPPELLRAGRFDRVFGVNLPTEDERVDILAIHLKKRGLNPDKYDLSLVAANTIDFSGAELEEVVITARHDAYDAVIERLCVSEGHDIDSIDADLVAPTTDELLVAAKSIKPLAVLDKESINDIKQFCAERTYSVSDTYINIAKTNRRRITSN
ncbi:MAG: AAA family ATPase [Bacteroidales bacterium]|jgi:SpoVK/Ycf46/Vps4 family AAA+-type ATPase|nr:AAA family ATPase [Bacteroidales bacterium]